MITPLKDFLKNLHKFFIDICLICLSYFATASLLVERVESVGVFQTKSFLIYFSSALFFILLRRIYQTHWRYTSLRDLVNLIKTLFLIGGVSYAALKFSYHLSFIEKTPSFSFLVLFFITSGCALGGIRIIYRIYETLSFDPSEREKILIVGVSELSDIFIRHIHHYLKNFKIVGFVDTSTKKIQHRFFHGYPILGHVTDTKKILTKLEGASLKTIYIADPLLSKQDVGILFDFCRKHNIRLLRVHNVETTDPNTSSKVRVRAIDVEDLLSRPPRKPNLHMMEALVRRKRVLITGAGGSIGSEIVRQVMGFHPASLAILDHGEYNLYKIEQEVAEASPSFPYFSFLADVADKERLQSIIKEIKPDVVFHAAAVKHVPIAESNPSEAVKTNIFGTQILADLCIANKVSSFILISTDKAVNPTSIMGATKRIAELYCQKLNSEQTKTRFTAVRFGNVLGSAGSVIPLFQSQIKKGGPITITHPDMVRFFMTIREAVQLVIQAGALNLQEEHPVNIYILDMGEPVKIVDLAHKLITLNGLEPEKDIQISFTGMRPGEKLFEELTYNVDSLKHTSLESIHISTEDACPPSKQLGEEINRLHKERDHPQQLVSLVMGIVKKYSIAPSPESTTSSSESRVH